MGSGAFAVKLVVALIDHPPIAVGAVPNLRPKPMPALAAFDFAPEYGHAAVPFAAPPALDFRLDKVESGGVDNGFMVARYVLLGDLTFVIHLLLGKEIHGKFLLQKDIALHFFAGQNALNRIGVPFIFSRGRFQTAPHQFFGYRRVGKPGKKKFIYKYFIIFNWGQILPPIKDLLFCITLENICSSQHFLDTTT